MEIIILILILILIIGLIDTRRLKRLVVSSLI